MPLSFPQPCVSEVTAAAPLYPALPPAAVAALWKCQIPDAIKLVRLKHDIGLNEAKELVDSYLRSQPALRDRIEEAHADAREGLFRWLIFLLAGGMGLAYVLM